MIMSGPPGLPVAFAALAVFVALAGRAQPWATGRPSGPVTVTHHLVAGLRAAAAARSRAVPGSMMPRREAVPGRSAVPSRVLIEMVRFTFPANPAAGGSGLITAPPFPAGPAGRGPAGPRRLPPAESPFPSS